MARRRSETGINLAPLNFREVGLKGCCFRILLHAIPSRALQQFMRVQIARKEEESYECKSFLAVTVVATSLVFLPKPSGAADDGAALYKSKCAGCHGAQGEGKPAVKAPRAERNRAYDRPDRRTHNKRRSFLKSSSQKGIAGVSATQAKAIAEFIKTLK